MTGFAQWSQAMQAACLLAVDPAGLGGMVVRANAGPVRDMLLTNLRDLLTSGTPVRRMPAQIADDRLLGGLDLSATLKSGKPVASLGLLAEADGGLVIAAMAERMSTGTAARLCAAIDTGWVSAERDGLSLRQPARFGLVALDEGIGEDEQPPRAIPERLAFWIDLADIRISEAAEIRYDREEIAAARAVHASVTVPGAVLEAVCGAAAALGIGSARAALFALNACRAAAALNGRREASPEDAAMAARLVLAPRATQMPQAAPEEASGDPPPPSEAAENTPQDQPVQPPGEDREAKIPGDKPMEDMVLEAASAAIPAQLLARLAAGLGHRSRQKSQGKAGDSRRSALRGRPVGARPGDPRQGGRLNILATLRAAAPMQKLRRGAAGGGAITVRRSDFRLTQFQQKSQTVTIFAVDASGSSALNRLAEAKGAVELLLAQCYVRRDKVALIAFRNASAEMLLPPTSSLTRVKKCLASLPGGGGTPLALGIDAAMALADAACRKGDTPVIVFLTDGQANIARDGSGGRAKAGEEALAAARAARGQKVAVILVDTSRRPDARAQKLAEAMGARYLPLPYADAGGLARAIAG